MPSVHITQLYKKIWIACFVFTTICSLYWSKQRLESADPINDKRTRPLKKQGKPHLHVLAYASNYKPKDGSDSFCRFVQSAVANDLDLTLIGWGAPVWECPLLGAL